MGVFQIRLSWKPETRLINRPLLFLLPFFIMGLVSGPALRPHIHLPWPLAALVLLFVLIHTLVRHRVDFLSLAILFLLIGAASTAQSLNPPRSGNHVFHFKNRPGLVFGGIIAQMPAVSEGRARLVVETDEIRDVHGLDLGPVHGRIYITVADETPMVMAGHRVRFQAKLREIGGFSNPGGFNYERYMNAQGLWVSAFLSPSSLVLVAEPGEKKPEGRFLARVRRKAAAHIDRYSRQPARGVFKAMLIGIRDEVDPDVMDTFRVFGLAHLLSISGLHVGVVALLSYFLIYRLLLLWPKLALKYNLKHAAAAASALPVLSYAALAGGRPSTIRAAVMVMIFLLSVLIDRKRDAITALAAAAWFILIIEPAAIFLASFQLSFAAAGAILSVHRRFLTAPPPAASENDSNTSAYLKHRLRQLVLIPLAATLGTAPIVAWHFHHLPALSLPVNIIFTPLISLSIIPGGLLALTLAPLCPWASMVLFFLLERIFWIFLLPLESLAGRLGVEWLAPRPSLLFITGYYLFFILLVSLPRGPRSRRKLLAAGLVLAVLTAVPAMYRQISGPALQMTVLDVGQGSAAHMAFPDHQQMIIDGGGFPGSKFDPGKGLIEPYLAARGITRLDVIVLSHPHADHVIGLPYLADVFTPKELWTNQAPGGHPAYRALERIAREQAMARPSLETLHRPRNFGPARVRVLWPPADYQTGLSLQDILLNQNDYSLVVKVTLGQTAFLIPGDLEGPGVTGLVREWGDRLAADVLVAPHHGDAESMTPALLAAVRPRYVVFSAGRFNRYHLPSPQAVERAQAAGAVVLRTDLNGALTFVTDGRSLKVKTNR